MQKEDSMFGNLKKMREDFNLIPYSKKLLEYSRFECWIMTIVLFLMQGFGLETGQLYQVCLAGWAGYGVAKALYYNMAKWDHQIQLLQNMDSNEGNKVSGITKKVLEDKINEYLRKDIES